MFRKILIANRGEIACRVIHTARRMGIATVAVFSDADRSALHVRLADEAIHIGESPAASSYLRGERILQAARRSGAEAIHPGYGFLSENADFARACEAAGVVFIGPSADAIDAMGSKARAKAIMADAGVPLIPGYHGDDQSDTVLRERADAMGYPVLLKATAGGGGKGMRAVNAGEEFTDALAAARRESAASFGDDRMLVEKLLQGPRHVEIQVFCDSHGNGVYLSERDCSIQRRHQKVIEEAPAPGLSAAQSRAMGEAAVDAAKAIDYRGAGTVEFLLDRSGEFYFMEMNTRLQVEHPVTELVTGLDLVEWQLRVAAGEPLPLSQSEVSVQGHAMEARVYAEDAEQGFVPATGRISYLRTPLEGPDLRIDTGVVEGSEISPYYDPMIAKLIVHGDSREEARRRLLRALREFRVAGIKNNLAFLYNIASQRAFADAELDTGFIERHADALFSPPATFLPRDLAAAAVALSALRREAAEVPTQDSCSPWRSINGWRVNMPHRQSFDVHCHGEDHPLWLVYHGDACELHIAGNSYALRGELRGDRLELELDGHRFQARLARGEREHTLFWEDGACAFAEQQVEVEAGAVASGDASFAAPMHGTIVALSVAPGTAVAAGDPVIVLEAMKMEQTLSAPVDGTVVAYRCAPGDLVDKGVTLVEFAPDEDSA